MTREEIAVKVLGVAAGAIVPDQTDSRLVRIEKILLGLEWSGVETFENRMFGGECVTIDTYHFRPLCRGYDPSEIHQCEPKGHRPGCLFLELPR